MKGYIKAINDLPWILKLLLALPVLDGIIYGLYRIFNGVVKGDLLRIILGVVWIFGGLAIFWIIDMISIIAYGKVKILA